MNIFETILSPFLFIIEYLFLHSYQWTGNYGIAIILLSFFISLLLLPVFIYIEKSKKKDDIVKQKMKPLIDEIKRVYKGQERYYYLKTINRQHNYSSFKALIPILSLLLQIPFFIAAYQYLENFEALKGVSFLFIPDLSLADGFFGQINILPIAMTIVNLITVFFYTIKGDGAERKQMLVLAIAFLILLFNLPSALVLYWTMNNVFSFFRLFITNPEVFHKNNFQWDIKAFIKEYKLQFPLLTKVFISTALFLLILQLYWAYRHTFATIGQRIGIALLLSFALTLLFGLSRIIYLRNKDALSQFSIKPTIYFSLLFAGIYFYLAGIFYYQGENFSLLFISFIVILPLEGISILFLQQKAKIKKLFRYLSILSFFIIIYQLLILIAYFKSADLSFTLWVINLRIAPPSLADLILPGILFTLFNLPAYLKISKVKLLSFQVNSPIFLLSIFYVFGLIFLWHPIISYSSYPSIFNFPIVNILSHNSIYFILFFLLFTLLYFIVSNSFKKILIIFSLLFAFLAFINTSLFPINLGTLQTSVFSEQHNLAAPLFHFILEFILILLLSFGILQIIKRKFQKQLKIALLVLNIAIIGQSLYMGIGTKSFFSKGDIPNGKEMKLKQGEISFSKTHTNVIVFLLDGFQGWYIKDILKEDTLLKNQLNGFVYYPNTVSISNFTHSSLPSIMNGYDYKVANLEADSTHTIEEKITQACEVYINKVHQQNYNFISSKMHHSAIDVNRFDAYIPPWEDKWNTLLKLKKGEEMWYYRLYENALLYSVPLALKPLIYNDSKWIVNSFEESKDKTQSNSLSQKYNFLRVLPLISNTNAQKGSFIYFHSMTPHIPWHKINDKGEFIQNITPYENNKWVLQKIGEWIQWMKENEVYDNTKIILVSDHGVSWDIYDGEMHIDTILPFDKSNPTKLTIKEFWRLNPLLMVKDTNQRIPLRQEHQLMCNADASIIAFNPNYKEIIDSLKGRSIPTTTSWWSNTILKDKKFKVYKSLEVKTNIFDLRNWKKIKEE